jgi:hypothetical protein
MYESTMDELYNLWDAVSPGGYVIIDDWSIKVCRKAITEFFSRNNLDYKITQVCWAEHPVLPCTWIPRVLVRGYCMLSHRL